MEDLELDFEQRWIPRSLDILASLQNKECMQLKAGWKKSRPHDSVPQLHERNEKLSHMELVKSQEWRQTCYFLTHHPVFKETSTTTETRVVFAGSPKTSNGLSLNDILQVGPTVQHDLYSIVLRFRAHHVCCTADIARMNRQINIHQHDQVQQRFLWRYSSEEPIQVYKLTTVTYGTLSAPYLATRCLKKLADVTSVNIQSLLKC